MMIQLKKERQVSYYFSKKDIIELCDFFKKVKKHIKHDDKCHMYFRDSFSKWEKDKHIDIEINIE